jgi:hypothetical protein
LRSRFSKPLENKIVGHHQGTYERANSSQEQGSRGCLPFRLARVSSTTAERLRFKLPCPRWIYRCIFPILSCASVRSTLVSRSGISSCRDRMTTSTLSMVSPLHIAFWIALFTAHCRPQECKSLKCMHPHIRDHTRHSINLQLY